MATSTDGHGYFLLFGVLQRANNVVFVFGLDYESRVHVVINLVGGRRILVLVVLVCLRSLQELIPCYASDSSHDFNVSMSGSSHGKEQCRAPYIHSVYMCAIFPALPSGATSPKRTTWSQSAFLD